MSGKGELAVVDQQCSSACGSKLSIDYSFGYWGGAKELRKMASRDGVPCHAEIFRKPSRAGISIGP
jgi:hypothetical protein